MENANEGHNAEHHRKKLGRNWRPWFVDYIKKYLQQRKTEREKETPSEKSARKTADASYLMVFLTLALVVVTIVSVCILKHQLEESREDAWNGMAPFIDLARTTVVTTPRDSDRPLVVLTLVNEGKDPAKKVRVIPLLVLRTRGKPLSPPSDSCFLDSKGNPTFGPTYPPDSPQIVIMEGTVTPAQRTAYEEGSARLYLYGRVKYQDFWREDLPKQKRPASDSRSSIFCRSFGKENEEFLRMKPRPEGAELMVPCTSEEWPFDDHHDGPETGRPYTGACTQQEALKQP